LLDIISSSNAEVLVIRLRRVTRPSSARFSIGRTTARRAGAGVGRGSRLPEDAGEIGVPRAPVWGIPPERRGTSPRGGETGASVARRLQIVASPAGHRPRILETAPMLTIRRILAPSDFSDASRRAVDYAADLAERFGAELALLHVVEIPPGLSASTLMRSGANGRMEPMGDYLRDIAMETLQGLGLEPQKRGLIVTYAVELGDAEKEIRRAAERLEAGLIVLGTHGRTGLRHLLLGSVAERVVRQSVVPVLTVRSPVTE
jgi:nucleotide-binding universal stress UspA family protein